MNVRSPYVLGIDEARRVIDQYGWARIVTCGDRGLRATYGFFLLEPSCPDEIVVSGHFAGRDPQSKDIRAGREVLLIFDGPSGFVSASWYAPELTHVPSTWNHVSVHLHGAAEPLDGDDVFDLLRRTLERHESEEPAGWELKGRGLEFSRKIAQYTTSFRLRASSVEAKAKLSQEMPVQVRERIVTRLSGTGPHANPGLAEEMKRLSFPERGKSDRE